MSYISAKPEVETTQQLETVGPTKLDPGLGSATFPARTLSSSTHITQQLAPSQASASTA